MKSSKSNTKNSDFLDSCGFRAKKMNTVKKTKVRSPQTNGICERFHKTMLQEFYQVTFRKKIYRDIDTLQYALDLWIEEYNHRRTHQGKIYCGRTPMVTLEGGKQYWIEKLIA